jgi:hypothetical protein
MSKINIEQVESSIAEELDKPLKAALKRHGYPIHESLRLRLSLLNADGRKKRSNAVANAWSPEKSEPAQFWLEPSAEAEAVPPPAVAQPIQTATPPPVVTLMSASPGVGDAGAASIPVHPAEAELLRTLDRAESTPGWSFVSLKKFRDEILPSADVPSIRSDVERQSVIGSAIEKRFVLTGKVQNPKSPQFPVTSIRLNRLMPEVQRVLGLPKKDLDFHPIRIKGEPLSAIILRERR